MEGCCFIKRNDKVREHQRDLVFWTDEGKPANSDHPLYLSLDQDKKLHTDWFRLNKFDKTKFPNNITDSDKTGAMFRFIRTSVTTI